MRLPACRTGILEVMTSSPARRRHLPNSPFAAPVEQVVEVFEVDDRVTHDAYGLGRIVNVEASAVTVDFAGRRVRITSPYPKLTGL